ncbi:MAG TPA: YdeI/OmpD-associated family protein [Anseongella sp.]|nr:YdeI/OmpD-associated family protein [Anseongella sp.]
MNEANLKTCTPQNKEEWREWLEKNHMSEKAVWVVYYKKSSGIPSISHSEAIDQALCFGWIDSKGQSIDKQRYRVCFTPRKPNSVWSRVNKEKVKKLIGQGLMREAGFASIETAKQNGSWTILDDVEALVIPEDLQAEFEKHPQAASHFHSQSKSNRKMMLQQLALAKRPETRRKRINEILASAQPPGKQEEI